MSPAVTDRAELQRLEVAVDGETAVLDYRIDGSTLVIRHTEVPAAFAGQGIAGTLVQRAFEMARERGLKVELRCSYAVAWLRRHPGQADLVVDGG